MSINTEQKFEYKEEEDEVYKYFAVDYIPVANREKALALIAKYNEEAAKYKYPQIVFDKYNNQIYETGTIGKIEQMLHSSRYKEMMAKRSDIYALTLDVYVANNPYERVEKMDDNQPICL